MNKHNISIMIITALLLTNLSSCSNINMTNSQQTQNKVAAPYYSVTNAFSEHDSNYYMQLDIKIPKIVYSGIEKDDLIDPINDEMFTNITSLVEKAKANAKETYLTYLESSKNNIENEKENKIKELKNKYKNIISSNEVKAIAELENATIKFATDSEIYGFNNTDLIIPGLHNKNIIIVDKQSIEETAATTISNQIKETSMTIEGRPGKKSNIETQTSSAIVADTNKERIIPEEKVEKSTSENNDIETQKSIVETTKEKEITMATVSVVEYDEYIIKAKVEPETEDETLTLDKFYAELEAIKQLKVPNIVELTKQYIPTTIICDFDVKCLDEEYLSLFIELYQERAVSHTQRFFYNIDLKNKKIVNIKDILGETYKDICIKAVNDDIDNWSEEKKKLLKPDYDVDSCINDNVAFFINNNHRPVIALDKLSICVGAAGYLEVEIN